MAHSSSRSYAPSPVWTPRLSRRGSFRRSRTSSVATPARSRSRSHNGRESVSELYSPRSAADRPWASTEAFTTTGSNFASNTPRTSRASKIKRWDGIERASESWDSIRKDSELWYSGGDLLVHLYARGQSRRGPSMRFFMDDVRSSDCMALLQLASKAQTPASPASEDEDSDYGGYFSNPNRQGKCELYLPAPDHLNRDEALRYHLTTRNVFAWMFEKPVVGYKLSDALIELYSRLQSYRPDAARNYTDFQAYLDGQNYTDFAECPDHALAILAVAERFRWTDLYREAFVHCVGMDRELFSSDEFSCLGRTTCALITRAALELDLRLERTSDTLSSFLENELTSAKFELSSPALRHLERFRSFLHSLYVHRHGYWPPQVEYSAQGKALPFSRGLFVRMRTDFEQLYQYLLDPESFPEMADEEDLCPPAVQVFDALKKSMPLPHSRPQLPQDDLCSSLAPSRHGRSRPWKIFSHRSKARRVRRMEMVTALTRATNVDEPRIAGSSVVREYAFFEREYTLIADDGLTAAEARSARWFMIYAILQTLLSVTNTPREIRDSEAVPYPLCCQLAGTPPWDDKGLDRKSQDDQQHQQSTARPQGSRWPRPASTAPTLRQSLRLHVPPPQSEPASRQEVVVEKQPPATMTFEALLADVQRSATLVHAESTSMDVAEPYASSTPPRFGPTKSRATSNAPVPNFSRRTPPPPLQPRSPLRANPSVTPSPCPVSPLTSRNGSSEHVEIPSAQDVDALSLSSGRVSAPTLPSLVDSEPVESADDDLQQPATPGLNIHSAPAAVSIRHSSSPVKIDRPFDSTPPKPGRSASCSYPDTTLIMGSSGSGTSKFVAGHHRDRSSDLSAVRAPVKHRRDRSSELARRWREEIRWRAGPGWDGDLGAILRGEEDAQAQAGPESHAGVGAGPGAGPVMESRQPMARVS